MKQVSYEEGFKEFFNLTQDLLCISNTEGIFLRLNPEWERTLGYTLKELEGKNFLDFIHPEDLPATRSALNELTKGRPVFNFSNRYRCKNGEYKWIEWRSKAEGGLIYAAARDITEHKKIENELFESRQMLQTVFDHIPQRVFWKDKELRYLGCNKQFASDAGLENTEEITGKTDFDLSWKENANFYRKDDKEVIDSNTLKLNYEELQDTPSGKRWLRTNKIPLQDKEGNIIGLLGTYEDITELKKKEKDLIESEEKYKSLFHNNHLAALLIRPEDGAIIDANPAACGFYGWTLEEITSMKIAQIAGITDKEMFEIRDLVDSGAMQHFDLKHRLANGSVKDVEVSSAPIVVGGRRLFYSIVYDITERKNFERELKLKNEQLEKIDKEKNRFFSILAHDLKSPFQGFIGLTELMSEEVGKFTLVQLSSLSRDMHKSANNLLKLLLNLLNWAQIQEGTIEYNPVPCSLLEQANQGVDALSSKAQLKEVEVINEISEKLRINADEKMINSVFRNLLSNAIKFTPRGGRVIIGSKETAGNMVEVTVTDNGIGIPEDIIGRLFRIEEKVGRQGTEGEATTGLGLILCREFIDKHNGKIWVESAEGKGTTFHFTLPAAK